MTETTRDKAPTAEAIERRFRSMKVLAARPMIWATIEGLKFVRNFGWDAHFEYDLHNIPGPLIFAANHRSHADTGAIIGTLPAGICRRTVVAAALDVFGPDSNGGLKRKVSKDVLQFVVAAGFHAFAFDRFGPPLRSVRTSVQLIRNGWSLLLYPEGTRSPNGEMAPFKPGVGLLARFTERPVVPIHVEGGEIVQPHGEFMPQPGRVQVRYGEPLWYQPHDTPSTFTTRVEEQVRQLGLRQPLINRASPKRAALSLTRRVRPATPQAAGVQHPY